MTANTWIYERIRHYIRKSWNVPDAITQAIADRRALDGKKGKR